MISITSFTRLTEVEDVDISIGGDFDKNLSFTISNSSQCLATTVLLRL